MRRIESLCISRHSDYSVLLINLNGITPKIVCR